MTSSTTNNEKNENSSCANGNENQNNSNGHSLNSSNDSINLNLNPLNGSEEPTFISGLYFFFRIAILIHINPKIFLPNVSN